MKTKKLELIIKTCSECPYDVQEDYEGIGGSYTSYICEKGAKGENTPEENRNGIREDCPLNDA